MRAVVRRVVNAAQAVADADPAQIEATALQLGSSRRYLAPLAWAAGALVLVIRGIKLLATNWRLSLIELVPAVWVWLAMWDLKRSGLRAPPLRHPTIGQLAVGLAITIGLSIAAFWCNAVFGFAISHEPPVIARAIRQTRPHLPRLALAGAVIGAILALGFAIIPRIGSRLFYVAAVLGLYGLMLTCLVVIPARILGVTKRRLPPTQAVGRWVTGGALSAVAMTPGFVLDRLGLILLGIPHLHLVGFLILSAGTALYAAGLSSVKAVKLSMKLAAT
jgi:hypothetical protein